MAGNQDEDCGGEKVVSLLETIEEVFRPLSKNSVVYSKLRKKNKEIENNQNTNFYGKDMSAHENFTHI